MKSSSNKTAAIGLALALLVFAAHAVPATHSVRMSICDVVEDPSQYAECASHLTFGDSSGSDKDLSTRIVMVGVSQADVYGAEP
ncbi:hypothetical protein BC828DRAFT_393448 [Blastocladiella britannica]|nr:hypothetical protein BC828DRAFT_394620 [Blastocladiella britannica]KAI9216501.1 hypothetical protein BC828DRAFT_393448 [Blastocladiella britannica]